MINAPNIKRKAKLINQVDAEHAIALSCDRRARQPTDAIMEPIDTNCKKLGVLDLITA